MGATTMGTPRWGQGSSFTEPSTKSFVRVIEACGLKQGKVLFVTPESIPVLVKSCRNLPRVQIRPVAILCAYDVVAADVVLFTRQALDRLSEAPVNSREEAERAEITIPRTRGDVFGELELARRLGSWMWSARGWLGRPHVAPEQRRSRPALALCAGGRGSAAS